MASGHWLLASAPLIPTARSEWSNKGAAWLRPGLLFGAVIIEAAVIHAALGMDDPVACAPSLAEGLEGGPLFYSRHHFRGTGAYTALVPASVGMQWKLPGAVAHPARALLLVPAPDVIAPREDGPWWVVSLDGPGTLCPPDRLAALVLLGREALGREVPRPGGDGCA
jgi:hypothetical protein